MPLTTTIDEVQTHQTLIYQILLMLFNLTQNKNVSNHLIDYFFIGSLLNHLQKQKSKISYFGPEDLYVKAHND